MKKHLRCSGRRCFFVGGGEGICECEFVAEWGRSTKNKTTYCTGAIGSLIYICNSI